MTTTFTTNPDGSRSRILIKPIQSGGDVTEIRLRPPNYRDIVEFDDPSSLVIMSGGVLPQIDMSRVASYLERLARDQNNKVIMRSTRSKCSITGTCWRSGTLCWIFSSWGRRTSRVRRRSRLPARMEPSVRPRHDDGRDDHLDRPRRSLSRTEG